MRRSNIKEEVGEAVRERDGRMSAPFEVIHGLSADLEDLLPQQGPRFVRAGSAAECVQVSLVIPAMNEERNIAWVLERVPAVVDEIILVDGWSVDETVAVSRAVRPDIHVIRQTRPGKGAALRDGFAAARGEVIVMIDADGSMDPLEIARYLALLEEGYDLVKGSRFVGAGGTADMERLRRYGNAALRDLANGLYGTQFTDLCYGFIAFRRDRLEALSLQADGFEIETEIVVRAVKSALRVGEVESFEAARLSGESNLRTWRDGSRVLRIMLRHRFDWRLAGGARRATGIPAGGPAAVAPGDVAA